MTHTKTLNGPPNEDAFEKYQELGCKLLNSMMIYSHQLRQEGLVAPSVSPECLENARLRSQEGLQAKLRVTELAQQVLAMTMDPDLGLLINSLQMAVDLRIGDFISKEGSISARELADMVGAEEALLVRIMRVLMTKHVFAESQTGFYSHTAMSWAMQTPNMRDLLLHRLDDSFRSASRHPEALQLNGYRNPMPGDTTGFNLAFGTKGTFWDYIKESKSERGARFNRAMKAVNVNRLADIPQLYPFAGLAEHGGLIVDVGGGLGQVSREILLHNPKAALRCVVQDIHIDPVIDGKRNNSKNNSDDNKSCQEEYGSDLAITIQHHNFFDPQPVKGAAAYFFRHIFHDWPDSDCITILKQTTSAMDEERSRILICDQLMRDDTPSTPSILYDIDMMALFGGKERTIFEINALIKAASERLYISEIKTSPKTATTIIEVRLEPGKDL